MDPEVPALIARGLEPLDTLQRGRRHIGLSRGGRTLRGAPCRSGTWLRGMLRAGTSSLPSATPAKAPDRGVPVRAAEGNGYQLTLGIKEG